MFWRLYGLIGVLVLFLHPYALADERSPSPLGPNTRIKEAALPGLFLPTHALFRGTAKERRSSGRKGAEHHAPPTTVIGTALNIPISSLALALPAPIQALVSPRLPRLTSPVPASGGSASKAPSSHVRFPWLAQMPASIPRVDQVWRVAPAGALARTYNGLRIDGSTDLGLEVHAGSTTYDRATNAIKGTASTHLTVRPDGALLQQFGQYLGTLQAAEERGTSSLGQLRMVLATHGAYTFNPSTRAITSTGEVVGTLRWTPTTREHFTPDPWQVVAARWDPSVSWEGRRFLEVEQKTTTTTRESLATLSGKLRGDLRLDFLSPQLVASGQYHYGHRLTEAATTWEQVTVAGKYHLNAQVSLGGSFTRGRRGANQPPAREFKLEIGVTF